MLVRAGWRPLATLLVRAGLTDTALLARNGKVDGSNLVEACSHRLETSHGALLVPSTTPLAHPLSGLCGSSWLIYGAANLKVCIIKYHLRSTSATRITIFMH